MTSEYATTIVENWKYKNEYAIYDYINEADHMLDSDGWGKGIFAVLDENGNLVGELSVEFLDENDEYVDYQEHNNEALINQREMWIGFGLKPELTGNGLGIEFVNACVTYAIQHYRYRGDYVRLGVAVFNQRAVKVYKKAGFQIFEHAAGEINNETFECVYMRKSLYV